MTNFTCFFNIKINLYKGHYVDDVIYYRYKIPLSVLIQFKWYFQYLSALVKVNHPREKVELIILRLEKECLAGDDYIKVKSASLLKSKISQLKKLDNGIIEDDLFHFKSSEIEHKKDKLKNQIKDLQKGIFNYYIPPIYINKIKLYI